MKRERQRAGMSGMRTISMPGFGRSMVEKEEMKMRLYLRRAASAMRRSIWATGRISPLRPTSPAKQTSEGIG